MKQICTFLLFVILAGCGTSGETPENTARTNDPFLNLCGDWEVTDGIHTGVYKGEWKNAEGQILKHSLAVLEVKKDGDATALYAYGKQPLWDINQPNCVRVSGKMTGDTLTIPFQNGAITATYTFKENVASGVYVNADGVATDGTFTLDEPTATSSSVPSPELAPAPLEYAAAGSIIIYADTYNGNTRDIRLTIIGTDGAGVKYLRANGTEGRSYIAGCFACGPNRTIDEEAYRRLWPLKVGNKTSFARTRANGSISTINIAVDKTETITVPAGTFDTYVLTGTIRNRGWNASFTHWWAPELGWLVKREQAESDADTGSMVLISFIPPVQ